MRFVPRLSRSSQIFIALMALYVALTFILPVNPSSAKDFEVSEAQYRYLLLIVKIPLIAAWSIAFYSYRRLREYANQIKDAPEGADYSSMARGTGWLAWGFAIAPIISSLIGVVAIDHPVFRTIGAQYNNFTYLLVTVVGLSYIAGGIHRLARRSKVAFEMRHIRTIVGVLVAASVVFCALLASRLQDGGLGNSYNSFYLPNGLVWSVIVIPYLYAWCLGIIAAFELATVARQTSGIIYKRALAYLTIGIVIIILCMTTLQYFRAFFPRGGGLAVNGTLITVYLMYALNAVGSVLLAIGVKKLKRIEDI